jgi:hypothetical protein
MIWDKEAKVWVAISNELPGFGLESESFDILVKKVLEALPEFIELNQKYAASTLKNTSTIKFRTERIEPIPTMMAS